MTPTRKGSRNENDRVAYTIHHNKACCCVHRDIGLDDANALQRILNSVVIRFFFSSGIRVHRHISAMFSKKTTFMSPCLLPWETKPFHNDSTFK